MRIRRYLLLFSLFPAICLAQVYRGKVFMKDQATVFLNQIYITNLRTQQTTISAYDGSFGISATEGDVLRFTSFVTERRDLKISNKSLAEKENLVELSPFVRNIQEVVIKAKPSGILKKDVLALKDTEKPLKIAEIIGLPEPKGDGYSPQIPVASFAGGGLGISVDAIYDMISGDKYRKERLKRYEIMDAQLLNIKNYFGLDYFLKMKIPPNMVDNFLQFVYRSDDLEPYLQRNNFEAVRPYFEKYLPVYLKRVRNSQLSKT